MLINIFDFVTSVGRPLIVNWPRATSLTEFAASQKFISFTAGGSSVKYLVLVLIVTRLFKMSRPGKLGRLEGRKLKYKISYFKIDVSSRPDLSDLLLLANAPKLVCL